MEGQKEDSVAVRILEAVISIIEEHGLDGVRTRAIASAAGVNIAAINYYFRTKELLIREAMSMAWKNSVMDLQDLLEDSNLDSVERFRSCLLYLLEGGLRFPRLTSSIFQTSADILMPGVAPATYVNDFLRKVSGLVPSPDQIIPDEVERRLAILCAGLLFPIQMPAKLVENFSLHLDTGVGRLAYVDSLMNIFSGKHS